MVLPHDHSHHPQRKTEQLGEELEENVKGTTRRWGRNAAAARDSASDTLDDAVEHTKKTTGNAVGMHWGAQRCWDVDAYTTPLSQVVFDDCLVLARQPWRMQLLVWPTVSRGPPRGPQKGPSMLLAVPSLQHLQWWGRPRMLLLALPMGMSVCCGLLWVVCCYMQCVVMFCPDYMHRARNAALLPKHAAEEAALKTKHRVKETATKAEDRWDEATNEASDAAGRHRDHARWGACCCCVGHEHIL